MSNQHTSRETRDHQQDISGDAQVGVSVSGDVEGGIHQQHGKIANRDFLERAFQFQFPGASFEEIARLTKSAEEIRQRWEEHCAELLDIHLRIPEHILTIMHAAVWPDGKPIEASHNKDVFHTIINVRRTERPSDSERILIFTYALLQQLTDDIDRSTLMAWVERATDNLSISTNTLRDWSAPVLRNYSALCSKASSLLVTIRLGSAPSTFKLNIGIDRPHIGRRVLLADYTREYTLGEIRELLSTWRQKKQLPHWVQGSIVIEFLLPFELLSQLHGEWNLAVWPCNEYDPVRRSFVAKTLGALNPIVVRSSERSHLNDFLESKEFWIAKWSFLSRWLGDPQCSPAPQIVCPHSGHDRYVSPDVWSDGEDIVGMVIVDPVVSADSSDYSDWLTAMLRSGLPVGMWLTPGACLEDSQEYMQQFFTAEALRDLPKRLWQERKKTRDVLSPAANLVLFWDDWERTPPDDSFWPPDEEDVYE